MVVLFDFLIVQSFGMFPVSFFVISWVVFVFSDGCCYVWCNVLSFDCLAWKFSELLAHCLSMDLNVESNLLNHLYLFGCHMLWNYVFVFILQMETEMTSQYVWPYWLEGSSSLCWPFEITCWEFLKSFCILDLPFSIPWCLWAAWCHGCSIENVGLKVS